MKLLDIRENAVTIELEQQDCRVLAYACQAGGQDGRAGYEARDVACAALAAFFDAAGLAASAHGQCLRWGRGGDYSLAGFRATVDVGEGEEAPPAQGGGAA